MLKKIQHIKKLGVFKDFSWDSEVKNKGGAVQNFVDINIIYGRNYSGKTTLSRIARALETGYLSEKYGSPSFQLNFTDNSDVTLAALTTHDKNIRVFNEDFIRDNLRFITNPDDSIEPFAILGDDNNKIEKEIEALEEELGSSIEGQETGLFAGKKQAAVAYSEAFASHKQSNESLEKQLGDKATNKDIGIKYKPERFGDQNYTITKLKADITTVSSPDFQPLTSEQVSEHEKLIDEKVLPAIPKFSSPQLSFLSLALQVETLITKPISESDKIQALVKDAVLNRWVNEGRSHHRNKHEKCAFCDNEISTERWAELEKHFDEESEQLEKSIDALLAKIETENQTIQSALTIDQSAFYSKFHSQLTALNLRLKAATKDYQLALGNLTKQLKARKGDILNVKDFESPADGTAKLTQIWQEYSDLCAQSELFSSSLAGEQTKAKADLRLKEVAEYLLTIDYQTQLNSIETLRQKRYEAQQAQETINANITEKQAQVTAKKRELNDEEKGAKKVNEYLNNFFGHQFLTLEAKKDEGLTQEAKRIRFEVIRDGKKAYHLSEGECSLLAFCYFLAKLDDVATKDSKPIIWIDDPISSLDGNHIFFIYSLLNAEVVEKGKFAQLFVSTHNLDFLKYLRMLNGKYIDPAGSGKLKSYQKDFFVVIRQGKFSTIQSMPDYLKKYITEFNYLFHQIYKCANVESVDDANFNSFYNFANNARKFFEIYLYYKYPDQTSDEDKLKLFFGDEKIPAVLVDRINNEFSHLKGCFESGSIPIDVPEMQTAARQIIERLKQDSDQFTSLMKSVGEAVEVETV
ncbi:AAA family ATPase [Vibrio metschnikovii]|uniref:AAA family ATPase n=2 Tax=Unclassified Bacteria TaxID=49928 RepID=A0AAU6URI2_UNCXX|nr:MULTISPECIES: AAA family ATPase [unclassified Vibrio]EKO3593497.1 AAA family ATPase [Vibrio metschnikovii]EKO3642490.1 AAA family ATPase [Vibrio metschnikovii]EKO3666821.1 AAA family ATPase [Vibrio metschnikovii]EKO3698232.1 AAA family ATPase [Vibrio metschnikovii]EKO3721983.1 AAA family ATPase [Vibrio metschnikovii]